LVSAETKEISNGFARLMIFSDAPLGATLARSHEAHLQFVPRSFLSRPLSLGFGSKNNGSIGL
jgi:hypothetical protein